MDRMERSEQIRRIFKAAGGLLPMRALAQQAIAAGLYSNDELGAITLRATMADCRRALAQEDVTGIPFAQPVGVDEDAEDGEKVPLWKQTDLFTQEEMFDLIRRKQVEILFDYRKLRRLVDLCRERFGTAPEIPDYEA